MMNLKDAASYALEQLHEAGADDAAVIVTSGKIDELNIDGGEFSLMRSGFKSGLSLKAIKEQKTGNSHQFLRKGSHRRRGKGLHGGGDGSPAR